MEHMRDLSITTFIAVVKQIIKIYLALISISYR